MHACTYVYVELYTHTLADKFIYIYLPLWSQLGACFGKSIKCNFLNKGLAMQWPNKHNNNWLLTAQTQLSQTSHAHILVPQVGGQICKCKQTKIVNSIFMLANYINKAKYLLSFSLLIPLYAVCAHK